MIGVYTSLATLLPAAAQAMVCVDMATLGLSTGVGQAGVVTGGPDVFVQSPQIFGGDLYDRPYQDPYGHEQTALRARQFSDLPKNPPQETKIDFGDHVVDYTVDYGVDLDAVHRRADAAAARPVETGAVMYAMPISETRWEHSDTVIERLMEGIPTEGRGWPRENFLDRLQGADWQGLFSGLDDLPGEIWLAGSLTSQIRALGLSGEADKNPKDYFQICLRIEKVGGAVQMWVIGNRKGSNTDVVLIALYQNRGLNWATTRETDPEFYARVQRLVYEDHLLRSLGYERKTTGWRKGSADSREVFLNQLRSDVFVRVAEAMGLKEGEGFETWLAGKLHSQIRPLGLSGEADKGTVAYFQIRLRIEKVGGVVQVWVIGDQKGTNTDTVLRALYQNESLNWARTRETHPEFYARVQRLVYEDHLLRSLGYERKMRGWGKEIADSREAFLDQLRSDVFLEAAKAMGLEEGEGFEPWLAGQLRSQIRALGLSGEGDTNQKNYFQIRLRIEKVGGAVRVQVIGYRNGKNTKAVLETLLNSHYIETSEDFFFVRSLGKAEILLRHLSEFGKIEILTLLRQIRLRAGLSIDPDESISVSEADVESAVQVLLLKYAGAFSETGVPWNDRDQRFSAAQRFAEFLSGSEFVSEHLSEINPLLQAAAGRILTRRLVEYDQVLRLQGRSPIAESGWDFVFSEELQGRLKEFAGREFPAHDYLRDPYNHLIGAYYHGLNVLGEMDLAREILLHLYYQRRRGGFIGEFYDGYTEASGKERARAIRRIQVDLDALEREITLWEQDGEDPFRISDGVIGGAARFLWEDILPDLQEEARDRARDLYPSRPVAADADLAVIFPQPLFFEIIGQMARDRSELWTNPENHNFRNGKELLEVLYGLGAKTAMGFGFGYETGQARGVLEDVTRYLMDSHPGEFRAYLEGSVRYRRNVVGPDGQYHIENVSLRRADLLAGLLKGYGLQELTGSLHYFRLDSLTREQELARVERLYLKTSLTAEEKAWLLERLNLLIQVDSRYNPLVLRETDRWYLLERYLEENDPDTGRLRFDVLVKKTVG